MAESKAPPHEMLERAIKNAAEPRPASPTTREFEAVPPSPETPPEQAFAAVKSSRPTPIPPAAAVAPGADRVDAERAHRMSILLAALRGASAPVPTTPPDGDADADANARSRAPTLEIEADMVELGEPAEIATAAPPAAPDVDPSERKTPPPPLRNPLARDASSSGPSYAPVTPLRAPTPAPKPAPRPAAPTPEAVEIPSEHLVEVDSAPQARARRARGWFERAFNEEYLHTLPWLTPEQTEREASFVIESLGLPAGAEVLDLGCGYGRHTIDLATRGYRVVGLDLSLPLLIRAGEEAQQRGLRVDFVHGDMRELGFVDRFDGAFCINTTFGYFDDETNRRVAAGLLNALHPGGRMLLEVINRDYILRELPGRVWWEGTGCVILDETDFNHYTSRLLVHRSMVFEDGRQVSMDMSMRAYSLHELGKLLHQVGFHVLEVSGHIATRARFFGSHSRSIALLCERPAT